MPITSPGGLQVFGERNFSFFLFFASSDIKVYPYEVAAASFALRSPYIKGAILCDEGSLGKTYEAMLVTAQSYYEGKNRILFVTPTHLLAQWAETIENQFSIPYVLIDSEVKFEEHCEQGKRNPFIQDGILLTSYDFAMQRIEYLKEIGWQLTVFDEAHHLWNHYTGENKTAAACKEISEGSFKLLLTATPIELSILNLFGLVNLIDDRVFSDEKEFYQRYFRRLENYPELSDRASKYCFRTLRRQASDYVKFSNRIPIVAEYTPTEPEQKLYSLLGAYLAKNRRIAYPKMEQYDLTLKLTSILSSSTIAFAKTLAGAISSLEKMDQNCKDVQEELEQLIQMF